MREASPDLFDYANRGDGMHAARIDTHAANSRPSAPKFAVSCVAWMRQLTRRFAATKVHHAVAAVLAVHPRTADRTIDGDTVLSGESLHELMLSAHGDIIHDWMLATNPHPWAERRRELLRLGQIMEEQIAATVREREARAATERRISGRAPA